MAFRRIICEWLVLAVRSGCYVATGRRNLKRKIITGKETGDGNLSAGRPRRCCFNLIGARGCAAKTHPESRAPFRAAADRRLCIQLYRSDQSWPPRLDDE